MLALVLLLTCVPAYGPRQVGAEEVLRELRDLGARKEWTMLAERGAEARESLEHGSDAWIEASAWWASALYWDWDPERLTALGRDVADAVRVREGAEYREGFDPLGSVARNPRTAGALLDVYVLWAYALQSRGEHESAVVVLTPIPCFVAQRRDVRASYFARTACIDLARSLSALGRAEEAERALTAIRDQRGGTNEAALATALLEPRVPDGSAYRGVLARDPEFGETKRALLAALPAARLRLAQALGREVESLPEVHVGVADRSPEHAGELAFTFGDPRRPFAPIVVVFADPAQLALRDLVEVLAHELAHAVAIVEIGRSYERLPMWVREGMANAFAGELDGILVRGLSLRFSADPSAFLGQEAAAMLFPRFVAAEAGLALRLLVEYEGIEGVAKMHALFAGGASLSEALERLTGDGVDSYLTAATVYVQGETMDLRAESLADLQAFEETRRAGPKALLETVRAVLARDSAPPLARHVAEFLLASAPPAAEAGE